MTEKIDSTKELKAFCKKLSKQKVIAVDTEFLREKTYHPVVCLIQIATDKMDACIDPLAPDMDLTPLLDVMKNENVLKVFHAARQDLEIFFELMGQLPAPLFDTQVGAMVCGLGESVSYHGLVSHFLKVELDKSSRITDWSVRPLSDEQLKYAAADVVYLIKVYHLMRERLEQNGRLSWVEDEMQALSNPALYAFAPNEAWKRLKPPSHKPRYLALLRAVCAWREEKAAEQNKPRRRIMRDETLIELAALAPKTPDDFKHLRSGCSLKTAAMEEIIARIADAKALPDAELPCLPEKRFLNSSEQAIKEMLQLLLNLISSDLGVAPKLIASSEELAQMAISDDADVPAMHGWRYAEFGQKAMAFKHGALACSFDAKHKKIKFFDI